MDGSGTREKSKSLNETNKDNISGSGGKREQKHTQHHLPDEILEQIISRLTLEDNIRTSAVSKRFLAIAPSLRKANKSPWLMIYPKSSDSYEFYDPVKHKSYWLDLPELHGARFFHSKDGWLLMSNTENSSLFLFYPYTREIIQLPELPYRSKYNRSFAFSAAPTSPKCMVVIIHGMSINTVRILTWRPRETRWTNVSYHNQMYLCYTGLEKLLFCNGLFYYFNSIYSFTDLLGIYNPDENSWSVQDIPLPRYIHTTDYWRHEFIAEHDGKIIITYTSVDKSPVVFKLDLPNKMLVEIENLGGRTLFMSHLSSHVRTNLLGNVRNVYLSYSFDKAKYFPRTQHQGWIDIDLFQCIWIDAPDEDLLTVLEKEMVKLPSEGIDFS